MIARAAALCLAAFVAISAIAAVRAGDAAAPLPGDSLYNLDALWTNQDGVPLKLSRMRGKFVVVAMGYTNCPDLCPAIVADMLWIDAHLPRDLAARVRFAFVSIDPKRDTPPKLKAFAEAFGVDQTRWTFLTGDDDSVRDLAEALGFRYRRNAQGGFDHSAIISLLDEDGEIAFQQNGVAASSQEFLSKLETLAQSAD